MTRESVAAIAGSPAAYERALSLTDLGAALRRLHDDADLRARLSANARRDVFPYTFDTWAGGFATAIGSLR